MLETLKFRANITSEQAKLKHTLLMRRGEKLIEIS